MNLCSFGFHDWVNLQTERVWDVRCADVAYRHKRVCLRCGKCEDGIAENERELERRDALIMTRLRKAEEIWQRNQDNERASK